MVAARVLRDNFVSCTWYDQLPRLLGEFTLTRISAYPNQPSSESAGWTITSTPFFIAKNVASKDFPLRFSTLSPLVSKYLTYAASCSSPRLARTARAGSLQVGLDLFPNATSLLSSVRCLHPR